MEKILFITAPYHCGVVEVAGNWLPLNFAYLADSAKKAGVEPIIYDSMSKKKGINDISNVIKEIKPNYIGLSAITATIEENLRIAKITKKINKNIKVILGGVHPSFMFEEILETSEDIDFIVIGEGEETLYNLLKSIKKDDLNSLSGIAFKEGGFIKKTKQRKFLNNLEEYKPSFEILDWEDYKYFVLNNSRLGAISSSRGCPHNCSFCSQQKFWEKSWRGRDPKFVVEEIKKLYKEFKVRVILLTDEYPTKDKERWKELLERIISLKFNDLYFLMETRVDDILRDEEILELYKKAGIIHIYVGVESGSQETLDLIKKETNVQMGQSALKLLRKYGFISETSFVIGFLNDTKSSIKKTLELAKYYNPDFAHFLCITPWPYSDLWEEVKENIFVFDYSKYNLIEPIIKPKKLTLKDLDFLLLKLYKDFYIWKFKNLNEEPFKKNYILKSFKLIMKSSFLRSKFLKYPSFQIKIPSNFKNAKI